MPQDTVLFSGTLYDNLLMADPHATFEQIVQACRMAEIHTVIEQLPQGYQTEIGERSAGLSDGQKQRLAIARTVNQLRGKVTMLFIAHALPPNLKVDEVVRIEGKKEQKAVMAENAEAGE